jgi:hypothetical protein
MKASAIQEKRRLHGINQLAMYQTSLSDQVVGKAEGKLPVVGRNRPVAGVVGLNQHVAAVEGVVHGEVRLMPGITLRYLKLQLASSREP